MKWKIYLQVPVPLGLAIVMLIFLPLDSFVIGDKSATKDNSSAYYCI